MSDEHGLSDPVSGDPVPAGREQFLIGLRRPPDLAVEGSLASLLSELESDPEIELVKAPRDLQDTTPVVVRMAPERAERLREQFSGELIVEPDRPLELF